MTKLKLTVQFKKHPNAVSVDDPAKIREIGFKVTTKLESDTSVVSELQDRYTLEQWCKDKFWASERSNDNSSWVDGNWVKTSWHIDKFGKTTDAGDWSSDKTSTTFEDEPGFLGLSGTNGRALIKNQRLGDYEVTFKWKVKDGSQVIMETNEATLKASPDNNNNITYVIPRNISIDKEL